MRLNEPVIAGLFAVALVTGCAADTDGDGLTDAEERDLGTDPEVADSDGDGLYDFAELDYGTDPLEVDSDGDGYSDRDEIHESTDALDPESRIYTGGWPYVFDKSEIDTDSGDFLAIGATFPRTQLVDQYGEVVDLYDFWNSDVPIVVDVSAEWCPPCRDLSSWISGGDDPVGYSNLWPVGPRRVRDGEVLWLTFMAEDIDGRPPEPSVAQTWEEAFPSENIPVLTDDSQVTVDYTGLTFWPSLFVLEPDLSISEDNPEELGSTAAVLQVLRQKTRPD